MSFGNIVNSLLSVREDYHEHLKTVPQYDAFLLVESSTERVANTLQGIALLGTPSMAGEVIEALETAKTKFRQHLTSVPEYRALLAIDKLISDISVDLGVQPASQAIQQTEEVPAAADTNAIAAVPETTGTVEQPVVAEPAVAESVPPIPQEAPIMSGTTVDEPIPVQAQPPAEVSSADAISQVQMALRSTQDWGETAPAAEADHASGPPAELAVPPVAGGPAPSEPPLIEPESVGQEAEKAA
jgi:hypothetical protein